MKRFMALLQESELQDVPPPKLRDEAGRLCQQLQRSPTGLEKLVKAVAQGRHWPHLCTSLQVVQACVSVHLRKNQHNMACKLLEGCTAIEKEQLVKLWHGIHYHRTMKKRQVTSLTRGQKYRCRKRNPPPASLCPDGVKSRNYSLDVRERLRRFAVEVTTNPSQKQREALARDTNLQPRLIYRWFANFRRHQRPRPSQPTQPADVMEPKTKWQQREGRAVGAPAAGGLCGDARLEGSKQPLLVLSSAAQGTIEHPGSDTGAPCAGNSSAPGRLLGELDWNLDPLETIQATKAEPSPAFAPSVPEVMWESAGPVPGPWGQDLTPPSRSSHPAQHKGVQCSLWSLGVCCQSNCSRTMSNLLTWPDGARLPEAYGEAGSRTVSECANWQIEALVLRMRQLLGSLPVSNLPPSSSSNGPVNPCPEESWGVAHAQNDARLHQETGSRAGAGEQAEGPPPPAHAMPPFPRDVNFQVPGDSARDPSIIDNNWVVSLLCELSSSSPV